MFWAAVESELMLKMLLPTTLIVVAWTLLLIP